MSSYAEDAFDRLTAAAPTGVVVYDGLVPEKPADRYMVLYAQTGTREIPSVGGSSDGITCRFQVTSVATVPNGANSPARITRALSRIAQNALVDIRLADDDWSLGPVTHTYSQDPLRDEAVMDRAAVYIVDQFRALGTRIPVVSEGTTP